MRKLLNNLAFLIIPLFLCTTSTSLGQLIGSLDLGLANCARPLTVNIQNGSGNYNLAWGVTPSTCYTPPNNSTSYLPDAQCEFDATYYVFARDNVTGQLAYFEKAVPKVATGAFSIWLPNVITPNNDGLNDAFKVSAGGNTVGDLRMHTYNFVVRNQSNTVVHTQNGNNPLGYSSGLTLWQPSPSSVCSCTYYYTLTATNCTSSQTFTGWIAVIK